MSRLSIPHRLAAVAVFLVGSAVANPAVAQQTHTVQLFTVTFSPANLTIDLGDTVVWQWATGFHDVISGTNGTPDGIFSSGSPVPPPATFQITFDAAFLAANPKPGNVYPFYCSIHLPVMVGSITVNVPPLVTPYGSGMNPPGSLALLSGEPRIGQQFTLGVSNTAVTDWPAAFSVLLLSLAPDPNFPAGTPLPGYSLVPAAPFGELLIGLAAPNPLLTLGPELWLGGTAPPSPFPFALPNQPGLVGLNLYFQGALLTPDFGFSVGLTNGLRVRIGS